jgi:hypothetical protein
VRHEFTEFRDFRLKYTEVYGIKDVVFFCSSEIKKLIFIKLILISDSKSVEVEDSTSLFTNFNEFIGCNF